MRLLKKFKCAICGCESANFKDGGRYCQKCKLIYGRNKCLEIATKKENNNRLDVSMFFSQAVEAMTTSDRQSIAKQLGGFPWTYNEQSKLDARRVKQADKDAKSRTRNSRTVFKICACCGERFEDHGGSLPKHCSVCCNVFGVESLKAIDKLSDKYKCEIYKIRRAMRTDEIKSITPPELHQNLPPELNIRLHSTKYVIGILINANLAAHALKDKKYKKNPFTCCRCGNTYLLEGEHPKPFICDRCEAYDEESRKGTKLRDLPGLPSMTYEHLALLPEYAACMFTKHMTPDELDKLKAIRAKVRPPKRSFTELIDDI